jgi:hypothetical protein
MGALLGGGRRGGRVVGKRGERVGAANEERGV